MTGRLIISTALSGTLLLLILSVRSTEAQVQGERWTEPHRLSSEEGEFVDRTNTLVADQFGYVHAFWVESGITDGRFIIQHARFDGQSWTEAIDIYTARAVIDSLSAVVDGQDALHLIWTEGGAYRERPVYYSRARVQDASSAKQWSSPQPIDVQAHLIDLQVDSNGGLHVLYSRFWQPNSGMYYTRSADNGLSWSAPLGLDPDILPDHAPGWLQFEMDDADTLHAVWFYEEIAGTGGDWVRYARSADVGENWSQPYTIARDERIDTLTGLALPMMAVEGQNVRVIWAGGDGSSFRNYSYSTDAGQNWSEPVHIFGNLSGQSMGDGLAIDRTGRLHLLSQIRWPMGIYHAYEEPGTWSTPSLIYLMRNSSADALGSRINAHGLRAAVRVGNQLVLTFHDQSDSRPHVLYAMHSTLEDIDALPVKLAPTPTQTPASVSAASTVPPTPVVSITRSPEATADRSPADAPEPGFNLLLGIVPAVFLLGLVVVLNGLRRR